jgi:peroxiredoxin
MNIKSIVFLLSAVAILAACSDKKDKPVKEGSIAYNIHGAFLNAPNEYVYLEEMRDKRWVIVDSVELDAGAFDFTGYVDEVDIYRIRLTDYAFLPLLVNADKISFTADAKNIFETIEFTGSKTNEVFANFNKTILDYNKEHKKLSLMLDSLKLAGDSKSIIATNCMNQIKASEANIKVFVQESITANTASPIVFSMLSYADWEYDFTFIEQTVNAIKQKQPNYKYTITLVSNVQQYKTYQEQQAAKLKGNPAAVGKEAPEFVLPDTKGKMVRLSSYRGKYVLIDFWASWCGPCRQESPNVVKAYNTYKGKNFDILSVSLDKDKAAWLAAIEKDGFTWKQVGDMMAWESSVVRLYQVEGIPATFLLDPNGIVIARDLRGKALEDKLDELLK